VRAGSERLPADTLALSTSNIWRVIKSQKDLNLPAHKVGGGRGASWCRACGDCDRDGRSCM
jgi:hypothetical protein